ncbi:MAG: hypothetical protein K5917_01030 [Clostridiales bacterium]|nr:hypothetical protein [Clostridiales bacterium]
MLSKVIETAKSSNAKGFAPRIKQSDRSEASVYRHLHHKTNASQSLVAISTRNNKNMIAYAAVIFLLSKVIETANL